MRNPRDNRVLNGFTIKTYDDASQAYKIDQLGDNLLKPMTDCNYPCKSCLGSNRDYCLECWLDGPIQFL